MLPLKLIGDTQFLKARELCLPVTVTGARSFVMPSASRPHLTAHHQVKFDSAESPQEFECSCEAGSRGKPCWAAARALDVLVIFAANGIRVAPHAAPSSHIPDTSAGAPPAASFSGRFGCRRTNPPTSDREAHPDALLIDQRRKPAERARGIQI